MGEKKIPKGSIFVLSTGWEAGEPSNIDGVFRAKADLDLPALMREFRAQCKKRWPGADDFANWLESKGLIESVEYYDVFLTDCVAGEWPRSCLGVLAV